MTAALPSRFPASQRVMVSLAILLGFAISPSSATAMVLMVDTNVFAERLQPDPGQRRPVLRGPDLLESGAQRQAGKMAASVFLFEMPGEQAGTPWMELSSAKNMNFFAQNIRNILYPNAGGNVNYATAISTGASQLNGNSFTGTNRQITLIDDATGFLPADPNATLAAGNAALSSGVDVVNTVAFDAQYNESTVANFYNHRFASPGSQVAIVSAPQGGPKTSSQINAVITAVTPPFSPLSDLGQWLFQGPPAKSKLLAARFMAASQLRSFKSFYLLNALFRPVKN